MDYPPCLEFGVPIDSTLCDVPIFKTVFFISNGENLGPVYSIRSNRVLPKFSSLGVLAHWSTLTQGTYGITLKPKAIQVRVYPPDSFPVDDLLQDDEEGDLRGAWRDRDTNDIFAHCSLIFTFLTSNFPTLFVLLYFIA